MKDLIKIIDINSLVISGGGMNGYLFLGVIKVLSELNIINKIKYYYGTSIGGFICICLNLGWTIDEILKFTINFPILSVVELNISSFLNNIGLIPKINYETVIKKMIMYKGFNENITFLELYNKTSKELNLITHSLKTNKCVIMNYINTPNIKVWEGLYATTSLPILFPPYINNDNNDIYIDGGIVDNFPINKIKLENKAKVIGICTTSYITNWDTFKNNVINKDIINYSLELIKIFFECQHICDINKCILINNKNSDSLKINMDNKDKQKLVDIGYQQGKLQINKIIEHLFKEQIKNNYNKLNFSKFNEI